MESAVRVLPDITTNKFTSSSITINATNIGNVSIPTSMNGYTPIGIVGIEKSGSGSSYLVFYEFRMEGNNARIYMRNVGSSNATVTITATILFKRNI